MSYLVFSDNGAPLCLHSLSLEQYPTAGFTSHKLYKYETGGSNLLSMRVLFNMKDWPYAPTAMCFQGFVSLS